MNETVQTQTQAVEEVSLPENNIDKGPYVIKQKHFSGTGQMRGFSYYHPQFKTDNDEAIAASRKAIDEKYGDKIVVSLVNSSLASLLAIKARNTLPKVPKDKAGKPSKLPEHIAKNQAEIEALRVKTPVLVSAEEADEAKPGEREITFQGLMRKAAEAFSNYEKEKSQGNAEKAKFFYEESKRFLALIQEHSGYDELTTSDTEESEEEENTDEAVA